MPVGRPWVMHHGVELRTIAAELRSSGDRKMAAAFRRELRAAAAPLVPAVRQSIATNVPSAHGGVRAGELRAAMQKATKLYVRTAGRLTGVVVMVDGRRMPPGQRSLPAYEEGVKPRWRHPVFGHTDRWVTQPPHPYFYRVVRPLGVASRVAVDRVITQTTRRITGRKL